MITTPILLTGRANERDDDCACPDGAIGLDWNGGDAPLFVQVAESHSQELPAAFRLLFSPYAAGGPSVVNEAAWIRWQDFATPRPLAEPIDQQLVAEKLLRPAGSVLRPQPKPAETLTAWLHITNACNLDCPYCYVRKSSARMSEETGLLALHQIFDTARRNGFKRVKLKYAGGEATLHFKLVRRLHQEAVRLAAESKLLLREVVLSNGFHLRAEDADWLADSGMKVMVSLDGVGHDHDQMRPLKGGGSTFAAIERTIDDILRPRAIRPTITITLTGLNATGVAGAVRWALKRDLPVSLNFYRQNLLSSSRQELALEEDNIIRGMMAAYDVFEEWLPERPFLNGLLDRVQAEAHVHTCGVQHSYLVVTHEGRLAQCQMHLNTPVGDTRLGGDLLAMVAAGPIHNLAVDQKQGCQQCDFRYRCTGGCPLETYRATGRWDVQSPHCRIYKTLMPAAFRLEGLRLMKSNGYLNPLAA